MDHVGLKLGPCWGMLLAFCWASMGPCWSHGGFIFSILGARSNVALLEDVGRGGPWSTCNLHFRFVLKFANLFVDPEKFVLESQKIWCCNATELT